MTYRIRHANGQVFSGGAVCEGTRLVEAARWETDPTGYTAGSKWGDDLGKALLIEDVMVANRVALRYGGYAERLQENMPVRLTRDDGTTMIVGAHLKRCGRCGDVKEGVEGMFCEDCRDALRHEEELKHERSTT